MLVMDLLVKIALKMRTRPGTLFSGAARRFKAVL